MSRSGWARRLGAILLACALLVLANPSISSATALASRPTDAAQAQLARHDTAVHAPSASGARPEHRTRVAGALWLPADGVVAAVVAEAAPARPVLASGAAPAIREGTRGPPR